MSFDHIDHGNMPEAIAQLLSENRMLKSALQRISDTVEGICAPKEVLDIKQAAAFLNKTVPAIYTMVSKGTIKYHKPDKQLQFLRTELLEWVRNGPVDPVQEAAQEIRQNVIRLNGKKKELLK